jgi:hypothetical protein
MNVLDPLGSVVTTRKALAPRRPSLDGVVIGVLDNSKPNARVLLERVARDHEARFGARAVRVWHKPGASMAAAPSLVEEIASTCQVVLTGSAD